jgi:hypothetical protein
LTADGVNVAQRDEYIPLAQGSVETAINLQTKALIIPTASGSFPTVTESPASPTNSAINTMFHIVHIDRLTGRATLEYQRVQ